MVKKVKSKKGENLVWTGTLVRNDTYYIILPISKWTALKGFFTGKVKLEWQVPATKKDKRLRIAGKSHLDSLIKERE